MKRPELCENNTNKKIIKKQKMAKNKSSRVIITLECGCSNKNSFVREKRKKGIFRYTTTKNRRNTPNRIALKKFCPNCNCHDLFKEIK